MTPKYTHMATYNKDLCSSRNPKTTNNQKEFWNLNFISLPLLTVTRYFLPYLHNKFWICYKVLKGRCTTNHSDPNKSKMALDFDLLLLNTMIDIIESNWYPGQPQEI